MSSELLAKRRQPAATDACCTKPAIFRWWRHIRLQLFLEEISACLRMEALEIVFVGVDVGRVTIGGSLVDLQRADCRVDVPVPGLVGCVCTARRASTADLARCVGVAKSCLKWDLALAKRDSAMRRGRRMS